MRARILLLIVVLVAVPAGTADAKHKQRHHKHHKHAQKQPAKPSPKPRPAPKPAGFDGSCEFSGTVTFTPALTSSPQPIVQHANAPGTCTGTFVDHAGSTHSLDKAPVTYSAESASDSGSCAFGMASGTGTLAFEAGDLAFAMNEYRAAANPLIYLSGKAGGEAWMPVTPSQSSDPVAAVEACNGGGLEHSDFDAHLQTNGPISG